MARNFGSDTTSALKAKFDAQKIAFAPIMFQAAKALRDFGILKKLLENNKGLTIEELVEETGLSKYGVTVLLEAGLSLELVMVEDDKYTLTKTGFFIEVDDLTRVNLDFTNDICYKGAFHMQEAIKTGKPKGLHEVFGDWNTIYESLAHFPEKVHESWFKFDHYYSDFAFDEVLPVVFASDPSSIIDLGGNTGKFLLACAKYSDTVKVALMDLPGQLKKATANFRKENMSDRLTTIPVNFLDKEAGFPQGYDVIWMSQFLDCFSEEEILSILERAKDVMKPDSEIFIMETFWDDQKFEASTYSLHATSLYFTCMANGNSRMYHSDDFRQLIEKSGLHLDEEFNNVGISHTIFRCKLK